MGATQLRYGAGKTTAKETAEPTSTAATTKGALVEDVGIGRVRRREQLERAGVSEFTLRVGRGHQIVRMAVGENRPDVSMPDHEVHECPGFGLTHHE